MIKIKTQSNTVSITDTAVQDTPLVEEEVEHINVKVSKVKMRTRSELATDNIYVTAKNMMTLNQIHKGVDDAAVQIYPEPTIVAVPTLSGTYTYTGQEQTVTISTYDPAHIAVSGDTAATNAGTYTVVFSLIDTDADVWEDGTTEDKTATWVIGKITLEIPTAYSGYTQVFDTHTHNPYIYYNNNSWSYDSFVNQYSNIINVGGDLNVTNAGEYNVTFDLVDNINYQWSDGTIEQRVDFWEVQKAVLEVPIAPEDIVYDARSHSPYNYNAALITVIGTASAINVDTYNVTYSLTYPSSSEWSDGTTNAKAFTWKIIKGPGNVDINTTHTMTWIEEYLSYSYPTGSLTVTSSDSSKVTATLNTSEQRIYLKTLGTGNVTITINIAGNNNAYAATKIISVINPAGVRRIGDAAAMSYTASGLSGTTYGNYMGFGGGIERYDKLNVYNNSLVRSTSSYYLHGGLKAASHIGNYIIFAGGVSTGYKLPLQKTTSAFDMSLTHVESPALQRARYNLGAASLSNYAIFVGGSSALDSEATNAVDAYNSSLTVTYPETYYSPSYALRKTRGAALGNYAFFASHYDYENVNNNVPFTYNTSLTFALATQLPKALDVNTVVRIGNYALICGSTGEVQAYNTSLVRSTPSALSAGRTDFDGATLDNKYALVGSGIGSLEVNIYDASLTRTINASMAVNSQPLYSYAGAGLGKYVLFAGGKYSGGFNQTPMVYTYI